MSRITAFFDRWLFEEYAFLDGKALATFRIGYSFTLLLTGTVSFSKINTYAAELYRPRKSLARWFDLPEPWFFEALDLISVVLLVCVFFGFKTRWTSLAFGVLMLIGCSFLYSFGKIDHGDLLVILTPVFLAFSGWGNNYSIDARTSSNRTVTSWPVSGLSLVIGFAMFTAGFQKLMGGWLDPSFHAIKYHSYKVYLNDWEGLLTKPFLSLMNDFTWEALDYFIILFELGFLVAVFHRKAFHWWIKLAILFHVMVFLTMDVVFYRNVIIYLLFVDWTYITRLIGLEKVIERASQYFSIYALLIVMAAVVLFNLSGWSMDTKSWIGYHRSLGVFVVFLIGLLFTLLSTAKRLNLLTKKIKHEVE